MDTKRIFPVVWMVLLTASVFAQDKTVNIKVQVPANTPDTSAVFIVGNQAVWGEWFYPEAAKLDKLNDSTWVFQGTFPANDEINFKITRSSYYKEAMYGRSAFPPPKMPFKLDQDTSIVLQVTNWNDMYHRSITGEYRYHHSVADTRLKYTRDVTVWLPPSYEKTTDKRYPVLYAHDGQNLFDASTAYSGEWKMDEVADSLIRTGASEEFIIVAINNTPNRWVEYSGTPEGMAYIDFIVHNLKPFIDSTYRTKPDRLNTAAIGSSMGGLISFYMVWLYPDVFSKAACLSSGFAYDEGNIVKKVANSDKQIPGIRLYLDCGGLGLDGDFLPANNKMNEILEKHSEVDLLYRVFPHADHNERFWSRRLWIPLSFLFPIKQKEEK